MKLSFEPYHNLSIKKKAFLLVGVPLSFWIAFVGILSVLVIQSDRTLEREQQQLERSALLHQVGLMVKDCIVALAVYRVNKAPAISKRIDKDIEELEQMVRDILEHPPEQTVMNTDEYELTARECRQLIEHCRKFKQAIEDGNSLEAQVLRNDRTALNLLTGTSITIIGALPNILKVENQKLLNIQLDSKRERRLVMLTVCLGVLFNSALGLLVIARFGQDIVVRINQILANSLRIVEEEELHKPEAGLDELSQLDQTVFAVAGRLQESTKKERAIVTYAHDLIIILDRSLTVISANPAAQRLLKLSKDVSSGCDFRDLIISPDRQALADIIPADPQTSAHLSEFECTVQGTATDELSLQVVMTWAEEISAWIAVARDVTEIRALEQARQELINVVSHDIRTPLTSMLFGVDALLAGVHGSLSERVVASVKGFQKNINSLLGLVNSLLDTARLQSGSLELAFHECDSELVVMEAASFLEPLAQEHSLQLVAQQIGCFKLEADAARLQQVVQNFLSNAIKFSPAGETIELRCHREEDQVLFEVYDRGPGVPASSIEHLFDRFWQSKHSQSSQGTGLGLFICKTIIELHKGEIGYSPRDGGGSIFWFSIPVVQKECTLSLKETSFAEHS